MRYNKGEENKVFHTVLRELRPLGYYGVRVENETENGTPDAFFQGKYALWIENKIVTPSEKTSIIKPQWQPGQIGWALRHKKHGGIWFVMIGYGENLLYSDIPKQTYAPHELRAFSSQFFEYDLLIKYGRSTDQD